MKFVQYKGFYYVRLMSDIFIYVSQQWHGEQEMLP